MSDTSVTKVRSRHSPKGKLGQKYLAAGIHIGMRLWEREQPGETKPLTTRAYETIGYVIEGTMVEMISKMTWKWDQVQT